MVLVRSNERGGDRFVEDGGDQKTGVADGRITWGGGGGDITPLALSPCRNL